MYPWQLGVSEPGALTNQECGSIAVLMHVSDLCAPDSCLLQPKSDQGGGAKHCQNGWQGPNRRAAELRKEPRGRNFPLTLNQDPLSGDRKLHFLYLAPLILGLAAG